MFNKVRVKQIAYYFIKLDVFDTLESIVLSIITTFLLKGRCDIKLTTQLINYIIHNNYPKQFQKLIKPKLFSSKISATSSNRR